MHGDNGLVVGLQVGFVAGQKVAALAGFGVQHALQKAVDRIAGLLPLVHCYHRFLRAHVPGFVDTDEHQRRQQGERQADRHRSAFLQPVP